VVCLHSVMKVKYSSPNFLISNNPASVPISDSDNSSVRDFIVAPHARAMRKLSVLRTRRIAVIPARRKLRYFCFLTFFDNFQFSKMKILKNENPEKGKF